jgi:hypothetical protein
LCLLRFSGPMGQILDTGPYTIHHPPVSTPSSATLRWVRISQISAGNYAFLPGNYPQNAHSNKNLYDPAYSGRFGTGYSSMPKLAGLGSSGLMNSQLTADTI